jgi:hypothetical protein
MRDSEVIAMKGPELIDRVRDEMAAAKNDYIAMLGEMLTVYLNAHAEAEIDEKKSLKGAFEALRNAARKKQNGGCYAMPPREAFEGMMQYYGLPHADADFANCMAAVIGQKVPDAPDAPDAMPASPKPTPAPADEFDLDALLGG